MYSIGGDWRKRHTMFDPSRFSIENYCTDTKKEMKHSFGDELFNNLHLLPDPLKKNLADSIITTDEIPKQRNKTMLNMETVTTDLPKAESSRPGVSPLPTLSGITSFFSGVMNVISSAMFIRRSPSPPRYYDCNDEPNVTRQGSPVSWHNASTEDQNKNVRAHDPISNSESDLLSDMSKDCLEAAAQCEDKLNRLRLLLKSKPVETPNCVRQPRKRPVSPPQTKTELGSVEKLSPSIQDNLTFANEINGDEISSVENSPAIQPLDRLSDALINSQTENKDYFNEISGKFHSTSATDSEDSFQIVFTDSPQTPLNRPRVPSDCESEDSFIVFEESPDSCYTSQDVFGEEPESDDDYSDSDAEVSDSGCVSVTKLAHPLSRTFGDLTDDSLYEDKPVDVVDCAVTTVCEEIPSEDIKDVSDVCETETDNEVKSTGLLLNDAKKVLRKNLPPKKVHFSPDPPKVHVMRVWAFAARQARAGHWERCAIDRDRFKRRIADVDMAVSWVLKPQHRSRVMFQRFMPWWNAQKRQEAAEKKQKAAEDKLRAEEEEERKLRAEEEDERLKEEIRLKEEERLIGDEILKKEDTTQKEENSNEDNTSTVKSDIGSVNGFKEINGVDEIDAKMTNVDSKSISHAKNISNNEIKEQNSLKKGFIINSTKKNINKNVGKKTLRKIVSHDLKTVTITGGSDTKLDRAETVSGT